MVVQPVLVIGISVAGFGGDAAVDAILVDPALDPDPAAFGLGLADLPGAGL